MRLLVALLVWLLRATFVSRGALALENLALRQQLATSARSQKRPRLKPQERAFWVALSRVWQEWHSPLVLVKPSTVIDWHRRGFRRYWRWRSRKPGRPRIAAEHIAFIRRISTDQPGWGEDRIAEELAIKLGIRHSTSTIRRYMVRRRKTGPLGWAQSLGMTLGCCPDGRICSRQSESQGHAAARRAPHQPRRTTPRCCAPLRSRDGADRILADYDRCRNDPTRISPRTWRSSGRTRAPSTLFMCPVSDPAGRRALARAVAATGLRELWRKGRKRDSATRVGSAKLKERAPVGRCCKGSRRLLNQG